MDSKSIFTSKTFWGAFIALIATFAPSVFTHFGASPDAATQASIVDHIVGAIAFGLTLYGRWAANSPVHIVPPKQGGQ